MQEAYRRVADGAHQRHVVLVRYQFEDADQRVLLDPDLNVRGCFLPWVSAVAAPRVVERLDDPLNGLGPSRAPALVDDPFVRDLFRAAQVGQEVLDLVVFGLGFADDAVHDGLIVDLPDGHRLIALNDLFDPSTPGRHLVSGRPAPLYPARSHGGSDAAIRMGSTTDHRGRLLRGGFGRGVAILQHACQPRRLGVVSRRVGKSPPRPPPVPPGGARLFDRSPRAQALFWGALIAAQ